MPERLLPTDVAVGDWIEARIEGAVHFTGQVTDTQSSMALFWAVSTAGERRIIEFVSFEVRRLASCPEGANLSNRTTSHLEPAGA